MNKNLGPFKLWTIENFPFIEADFDAITNYQLYSKIVEYLKKVADNQTVLQNEYNDIVNKYNELISFVNNYFENLDVQEEIDNKLDEMAQDGTLQAIITSYLQINGVLAFDTIADMSISENLIQGCICYCLGTLTYNDGKGIYYKVRHIQNTDVVDGYNIVSLVNTDELIGERIPDFNIDYLINNVSNINNNLTLINNDLTNLHNTDAGLQDSISNIQSQVSGLASGSPLSASSTSEMTDTDRIYVNTTDGKWYYYDGTEWVIGGTYQATAIGDGEVGIVNLDTELQGIVGISIPTYTFTNDYFIKYNGEITAAANYCYSSPIQLKKHQIIRTIARGANTNVSMITKCDVNGDNLVPVVISIDNDAHLYSYEALEDTYVILSGRKNYINEVFIIDDIEKITTDDVREELQNTYDYSIMMNNNSPVIYGGTTLNDYSKDFEQGYFSNGVPSTSTIRIRSIDFIVLNLQTKIINLLSNSSYRIFTYETDGTYVGVSDWISTKSHDFTFTDNKKYKFALKFNDDSTIVPQDILNKFFILSGQTDLSNTLQDILDLDTGTVPSYWQTTIDGVVEDINELMQEKTDLDNEMALFFIVADPHYPANNYVSSKLIKYISKKCGINLTLCLGDFIQDSTVGHQENLNYIQNAMNEMLKGTDRLLITQGNHDNGAGIPDSLGQIKYDRVVPDNEWIHHTSSKLLVTPKIEFDELGKAFYYDDPINKIRFISLDSFEDKSYTVVDGVITSAYLGSCTNRQIAWLTNVALANIPTGYSVITFSHKPIYKPEIEDTEITNAEITVNSPAVVTALNAFITGGGDYICHLAGHQHFDFLNSLNNIPQIITLNDGKHRRSKSYWGSQADLVGDAPLKTAGTTTECAFDIAVINKTTKHIDLFRIGAGSSRDLDY